ncbi:MAG: zinc-binding dehydrogenase [Acidimicrobiia bacterium]
MRAWLLHDTAGIDSFDLSEIEAPDPSPGEVRVELRTSALNHLDVWVSMGLPAPKSFPHIAGGDGAGVVESVGDGVSDIAPGEDVIINPSIGCGVCDACLAGDTPFCIRYQVLGENRWGTLADYVVLPARNVTAKPERLSWDEAGAYALAYGTAYRMLRKAGLEAGDRLLIAGIGGGVAAAGLALGVALGAKVFVTSRDPQKISRALELGAAAGYESSSEFSKSIKEDVSGVDVVLDNVGPATFDQSFRSLVRGGRLLVSGGTSGTEVTIKVPYLFFRQIEVIGSSMFDHREFDEVTELVTRGQVPVLVDSTYEFEELPKALARMDAGEQFGKLVVRH